VHKEMKSAGFLVWFQNQGRRFGLKTTGTVCQSFVLKTTRMVSIGLASKLVAWVSQFGPQNRQLWFGNLGLKITVTVS
jgi:hypothetical protein